MAKVGLAALGTQKTSREAEKGATFCCYSVTTNKKH